MITNVIILFYSDNYYKGCLVNAGQPFLYVVTTSKFDHNSLKNDMMFFHKFR
uniref:Uncharacterized protein n=1 Tax=uncultured alpha proteobacterium HF0130_20P23 TaxID=710809 RepID=E0XT87_9PROT|nr:hypothetical protein [uncultured alpha proteobacterium HF0130_20P23]